MIDTLANIAGPALQNALHYEKQPGDLDALIAAKFVKQWDYNGVTWVEITHKGRIELRKLRVATFKPETVFEFADNLKPVDELEPEPVAQPLADPEPAPVPSEVDALRDRITELEEQVRQLTPEPEPDVSVPPPEVLAEAQPDEDLVELKARLLGEFASLRNMLIGHIPMTEAQLLRLQALEHPKFQTWLQA
jgi:hypothetical protein